jgi:hypothetical protein
VDHASIEDDPGEDVLRVARLQQHLAGDRLEAGVEVNVLDHPDAGLVISRFQEAEAPVVSE